MKKIDRREYLKRMAAAAGGLSLAQFNRFNTTATAAQRTVGSIESGGLSSLLVPEVCPTSWPCTSKLPENPTVRLIFAGMVGFTYKIIGFETEGRAIFHRGDDGHKLKVIVHKGSSPNCTEIYRNEAIPKQTTFDIRVRDRSDANFFMSTTPFKREDLQGDDKDFRWLLDLEAP